jgi:hypothetical protein
MSVAILAAIAGASVIGCAPEHRCDPGQVDLGYACYSPPGMPDGAVESNAAAEVIPPDSVMCTDKFTGFAYGCNAPADCPCGLDFCIIYGGPGYCTRTGCADDPSLCPQGWSCVDLGLYSPGLTPTCVKT